VHTADVQRANEIVKELRAGIEIQGLPRGAQEGCKIFLPNVLQPEYHFTITAMAF
jgi:hypothetical protein